MTSVFLLKKAQGAGFDIIAKGKVSARASINGITPSLNIPAKIRGTLGSYAWKSAVQTMRNEATRIDSIDYDFGNGNTFRVQFFYK